MDDRGRNARGKYHNLRMASNNTNSISVDAGAGAAPTNSGLARSNKVQIVVLSGRAPDSDARGSRSNRNVLSQGGSLSRPNEKLPAQRITPQRS